MSILVPVYNERAYLQTCIERVLGASLPDGLAREIVIVDDASTDGTTGLVRQLAADYPDVIRAFFQQKNSGKGAAVRRAIEEMRGDYAIIQDADLEYDPSDYPTLLSPILRGYADVTYGSRFVPRTMRRVLNYHHTLGNKFLTHLSNVFTGLNLTDMETCYKAFRADILKTIPIRSNRFGIEPEITAKVAKRRCVVYEVPISYHGRAYDEGKKVTWRDGLAALYTIIKYWLVDDCVNERYGEGVLISMSTCRRLSRWTVGAIEPYLGQRILEVGAGMGNISVFLPKRGQLTVTDVDPHYLGLLGARFRYNALVSTA
ncbi:MAG: glycosyltransferase, partial [Planctomycetota bacterium]